MAKDISNPAAPRTTPDYDAEMPAGSGKPAHNKPMGFLAYANKRHYPSNAVAIATPPPPPQPHHQPHPQQEYKQCMRNHAAAIGGHALDGCCEFMPSPLFNPSDPTSLRCAACGCHRNFHRHDGTESESPSSSPLPLLPESKSKTQPGRLNSRKRASSSSSGAAKKRFRTRFSQDQKDMMYHFAESLGWKMHRVDRNAVEEFCTQIGVPKEVLKVWIHNNKNTLATKDNHNHKDINNGAAGDRFEPIHLLSANASSSSSE